MHCWASSLWRGHREDVWSGCEDAEDFQKHLLEPGWEWREGLAVNSSQSRARPTPPTWTAPAQMPQSPAASLTASCHHPTNPLQSVTPTRYSLASSPSTLALTLGSVTIACLQFFSCLKLLLPQGLCTGCMSCLDTPTHTSLPDWAHTHPSALNANETPAGKPSLRALHELRCPG